jgi:UDP:flavonoid glycosyltransferase YjiC (YdhE family)
VLAYLSADCAELALLLRALAQADVDTVGYVGGRGSEPLPPAETGSLVLRTELFDVGPAVAQCDLLVCHAANGLTAAALAAGKPALMWPMTAEQQLFAHRVAQTGAGAVLDPELNAGQITRQVRAALDSGGLATHARALAARHAQEPDGLACGVQAIVEWLAGTGGP